jgi:phosphatidylinositol kinase/protein kinase (PI-3  family)
MGVPNTEAILYFLKKYSQSAQDFCTIKDNFKRSLAGYFIICYVLGIM